MIKCVVCSQEVTSKRGLAFHIKKHDIDSISDYLKLYPDQTDSIEPKDDTLLTCPICGRYNMKQLGQHIVGTHRMTHEDFLKLYPEQKMFIDEISERCKKATAIGNKKYYENKAANPEKYEQMIKERTEKRKRNNPDIGIKVSNILREHGVYERMSDLAKKKWQEPEYRKFQCDKTKKQHENGLTDIVVKKSYKNRSIKTTIGGIEYTMRSNWEIQFAELLYLKGIQFEYEDIKLKYFYSGKFHTYYPDFKIKGTNILFEIKPYTLVQQDRNKAKQRYSIESGYDFRYITEYELKDIESINFKGCF